jgi:hypothetical protein
MSLKVFFKNYFYFFIQLKKNKKFILEIFQKTESYLNDSYYKLVTKIMMEMKRFLVVKLGLCLNE